MSLRYLLSADDEELADDVEEPRSEPTASSIAPEGTSDADLNHKGADANSVKPEVVLVDSTFLQHYLFAFVD